MSEAVRGDLADTLLLGLLTVGLDDGISMMRRFGWKHLFVLVAGVTLLVGCPPDEDGADTGIDGGTDVPVDGGEPDSSDPDVVGEDGGDTDGTTDVAMDVDVREDADGSDDTGETGVDADGGDTVATTIQVFHNSPDPAADPVDVWARIDGEAIPLVDDLEFRQYTARLAVPAEAESTLVVAAEGSADDGVLEESEIVENFPGMSFSEETHTVVAINGVVDPNTFERGGRALSLATKSQTRSSSRSGNAEVLALHGVHDAPAVDLAERNQLGSSTLVDGLAYGAFSDDYLQLAANSVVDVGDDQGSFVTNFQTPTPQNFGTGVWTVAASGFLTPGGDDQTGGSRGPKLRFVGFPNVGPETVSREDFPVSGSDARGFLAGGRLQVLHAATADAFSEVDVSVDGTQVTSDLGVGFGTDFRSLPVGLEVPVEVTPAGGGDGVSTAWITPVSEPGDVSTWAMLTVGDGDDRDVALGAMRAVESRVANPAAPDDMVALNVLHAGANPELSPVDISVRHDGSAALGPFTDIIYSKTTGVSRLAVGTAANATVRLRDGMADVNYDFPLSALVDDLPNGTDDLSGRYFSVVAVDCFAAACSQAGVPVQLHVFREQAGESSKLTCSSC